MNVLQLTLNFDRDYRFLVLFDRQNSRAILINPLNGNSRFATEQEAYSLLAAGDADEIPVLEGGTNHASVHSAIRIPESVLSGSSAVRRPLSSLKNNFQGRRARTPKPPSRAALVLINELKSRRKEDDGPTSQYFPRRISQPVSDISLEAELGFDKYRLKSRMEQDARSFVVPVRPVCEEPPQITISKVELRSVKVCGIFANAFLICELQRNQPGLPRGETEPFFLIVDQHALHERLRLENLQAGCLDGPDCLKAARTAPVLQIPLTDDLKSSLQSFKGDLLRYGFDFVADQELTDVKFTQIPQLLLDKNPISRDDLKQDVLICLTELFEYFTHACRNVFLLPPLMHNWLASIACKGAIKVGDALPERDLQLMFPAAANCSFPFQCAHGRPSMAPLVVPSAFLPRLPEADDSRNSSQH